MRKYQVEHNEGAEWHTVVREDLYDGTNDDVLQQSAVFASRKEAEEFVLAMCGLMHMGGDPDEFRIVEL